MIRLIQGNDSSEFPREMEAMFREQVVSFIKTMNPPPQGSLEVVEEKPELILSAPDESGNATKISSPRKNTEAKVGRNDPCPCGSGKKYKHCHGAGK